MIILWDERGGILRRAWSFVSILGVFLGRCTGAWHGDMRVSLFSFYVYTFSRSMWDASSRGFGRDLELALRTVTLRMMVLIHVCGVWAHRSLNQEFQF